MERDFEDDDAILIGWTLQKTFWLFAKNCHQASIHITHVYSFWTHTKSIYYIITRKESKIFFYLSFTKIPYWVKDVDVGKLSKKLIVKNDGII